MDKTLKSLARMQRILKIYEDPLLRHHENWLKATKFLEEHPVLDIGSKIQTMLHNPNLDDVLRTQKILASTLNDTFKQQIEFNNPALDRIFLAQQVANEFRLPETLSNKFNEAYTLLASTSFQSAINQPVTIPEETLRRLRRSIEKISELMEQNDFELESPEAEYISEVEETLEVSSQEIVPEQSNQVNKRSELVSIILQLMQTLIALVAVYPHLKNNVQMILDDLIAFIKAIVS